MKKLFIFMAAVAFLSFSCNKYCSCKYYVDGKEQKKDKFKSEFVNESGKCKDYSEPIRELDGKTYETKCK